VSTESTEAENAEAVVGTAEIPRGQELEASSEAWSAFRLLSSSRRRCWARTLAASSAILLVASGSMVPVSVSRASRGVTASGRVVPVSVSRPSRSGVASGSVVPVSVSRASRSVVASDGVAPVSVSRDFRGVVASDALSLLALLSRTEPKGRGGGSGSACGSACPRPRLLACGEADSKLGPDTAATAAAVAAAAAVSAATLRGIVDERDGVVAIRAPGPQRSVLQSMEAGGGKRRCEYSQARHRFLLRCTKDELEGTS